MSELAMSIWLQIVIAVVSAGGLGVAFIRYVGYREKAMWHEIRSLREREAGLIARVDFLFGEVNRLRDVRHSLMGAIQEGQLTITMREMEVNDLCRRLNEPAKYLSFTKLMIPDVSASPSHVVHMGATGA